MVMTLPLMLISGGMIPIVEICFAWNSELKYPDDYDPIDHFEQRMNPKKLVWEEYPKF